MADRSDMGERTLQSLAIRIGRHSTEGAGCVALKISSKCEENQDCWRV